MRRRMTMNIACSQWQAEGARLSATMSAMVVDWILIVKEFQFIGGPDVLGIILLGIENVTK